MKVVKIPFFVGSFVIVELYLIELILVKVVNWVLVILWISNVAVVSFEVVVRY